MKITLARAALMVSALVLAGCNASLEDIAPTSGAKAERRLPAKLVGVMQAKGMSTTAPIMLRVFKEEAVLEVWKQKANGRYDLVTAYDICKWSGKLGPKYTTGDRQAPEGFYDVTPAQMNPNSSYHLSFNMGFPNAYDRANGRTGQHLMVHGACSSSGCYSMTDGQVEEIFAFAREAFRGGQQKFQIQALPFRMTPDNMARYRDDPNFKFWTMLKEGYDHFEITKTPPKVDVCDKRYVFNLMPEGESDFRPTMACPATIQPETLVTAFKTYQSTYQSAFVTAASLSRPVAPKPSIAGIKEANIVAEWSRKRARGERVPMEPPVLASDGSIVQTTSSMGRLKSAIEAEERARLKAEANKPKPAMAPAKASAPAAVLASAPALAAKPASTPVAAPTAAPTAEPVAAAAPQAVALPSFQQAKKRLLGMFGG